MKKCSVWRVLVAVLVGASVATTAFGAVGAGGFLLRGGVVGFDGAPVTEGTISFGSLWSGSGEFAGRFEMPIPEALPGLYPLTYTSAHGDALVLAVVPVAAGRREADVTLRLGEELAVRGRVIADDMPDGVPNARLILKVTVGGEPYERVLWTTSDGGFALYGQAFAGATIMASNPYHGPAGPIAIAPPFPTTVELHLPRATLVIGQVTDENGSALDSPATVAAFSKDFRTWSATDERGRFGLSGLLPGEYRLQAYGRNMIPDGVTLRFAEGQQVVGLTLSLHRAPQRTVFGRLLGPDGTTGVPGAEITFRQPFDPPAAPGDPATGFGGFIPEETYSTVTTERGYYSLDLPVLPAAVHTPELLHVTISASGYLPRHYVVHRDALFREPLDFQVFRGGRLRGTVRFLDGRPLPKELTVDLQVPAGQVPPAAAPSASTTVRSSLDLASGRFDFGLVQPGENWVLVEVHGDRVAQLKVTVVEGQAQEVEVAASAAEAARPRHIECFGDESAPIRVEFYAPLAVSWHQQTIALLRDYDRQHPGRIRVKLMPMGLRECDGEMLKRGFTSAVIFINGEHAFTLPDGRKVDLVRKPNDPGASTYNREDVIAIVESLE